MQEALSRPSVLKEDALTLSPRDVGCHPAPGPDPAGYPRALFLGRDFPSPTAYLGKKQSGRALWSSPGSQAGSLERSLQPLPGRCLAGPDGEPVNKKSLFPISLSASARSRASASWGYELRL